MKTTQDEMGIIRPILGLRRIEIDGIWYPAGYYVNLKEKRKFLFFSWPQYKLWKIDVICKDSTAILSNGDNQKIITGSVKNE